MIKFNNSLAAFLLLTVLILGTPQPAVAATYRSFLRINKIYVLYTAPIVPHADGNGTFWVGLRSFAALIGARFQENDSSQSVTLTCHKHTLTLVADARQVILDDKIYRIPVAAKRVGTKREWVAPVLGIARAFGLHTQMARSLHVLTVVDEDLFDKGSAEEWVGQILQFEGPPRGYVQRVRVFTGPPYPLAPVVPTAMTQSGYQLVWQLWNLSGKDVVKMDINLLVNDENGQELDKAGVPWPASFSNPMPNYPIKARQTLDFGVSIADKITNDFHAGSSNPATGTVTTTRHRVACIVAWLVP